MAATQRQEMRLTEGLVVVVAGGKQHHSRCRAFTYVFPTIGVAGFFNQGAFEGIHVFYGLEPC